MSPSTIAWVLILGGVIVIRATFKGQLFDKDGTFVLPELLSKLIMGGISGDEKQVSEALNSDSGGGLTKAQSNNSVTAFTTAVTSPSEWDSLNPNTVGEAIEWAQNKSSYAPNRCEEMVTRAYGRNGGFPSAKAHADAMQLQSGTPPAGALVFWQTGNPYGHVALSIGNGYVISTDFDGSKFASGRMSSGPIEAIDKWGKRRGWSQPKFN